MEESQLLLLATIVLFIGWFVVFNYAVPPLLRGLKKDYEAGAQWHFHWIDFVFLVLGSYSFYDVILRNWFSGSPAFYAVNSHIAIEIGALVFYFATLVFFGATSYIFFDMMVRVGAVLALYFFVAVSVGILIPTGQWTEILSTGEELWTFIQLVLVFYFPAQVGRLSRAAWYYFSQTTPPPTRVMLGE